MFMVKHWGACSVVPDTLEIMSIHCIKVVEGASCVQKLRVKFK
jgi:hypothetical protein